MKAAFIPRFIVLLMVIVPAFGQPRSDTANPGPDKFAGTRAMIKLINDVTNTNYRPGNPFATAPRVDYFRDLVKSVPENEMLECQELINAGRQDEAIPKLIAIAIRNNNETNRELPLDRLLALAYLRQGEQDNCVSNHTAQSCLFPIGPGGYYTLKRGPRAAIEILNTILDCEPDDIQSQWLLNIAYQTINEYPDSVPARWLLAPDLFKSEYTIPKFNNVAPQLGIDDETLAGGSVTEDFDLDGDIDILTSSWGMKAGMRYYRNNGDGTFTDATESSGLVGLTGGLNMIHADYNNDGYPDVLVLRGGWMQEFGRYPNSLLRNNGDGTFTDVTIEAGLLSYHPTQTAIFADLNNDGWLDIFIGNESARQPHTCELFINNGNGTFTERAKEAGIDLNVFTKGVTCGDYNNDGLTDIYLSCNMQANHLMKNNGVGKDGKLTFTDVTTEAGVGAPVASFPALFFDYDNDGWDDLFVCGYGVRVFSGTENGALAAMVRDYLHLQTGAERPRLYHNNHDGTFSDVTRAAKLDRVMFGMGCNFGDIDNDGFPDIYVGTGLPDLAALMPNRMFRNNGGKDFQDVTTAGGFGHLQKGHAISFADLDNDGDQDVYTVVGGAFEGDLAHKVLFENPGNGNHWITLKLEGVRTNRMAVGARIQVTIATPGGTRSVYATVNTGGSFGSSTLQQEMGLGAATAIRSITVTWPTTKTKQVFKDVAMDHFYNIREDATAPVMVERNVIHFKNGGEAGEGGMMMMHHHMQ